MKVVCATRGGQACRRMQEKAIELAKERQAELIFLFVADPALVGPVDEPLLETLRGEMGRLGRSLVHIARGRALKAGLKSEMAVVHGPVQESITDFMRQVGASTLVMGAPRSSGAAREFSEESIDRFAEAVRQDADVEVVIVL